MNGLPELAGDWRRRAELLRTHGAEEAAKTCDALAAELEASISERENELLTLAQAQVVCGYSRDHLARLIRNGAIPNAGRRHAPRVRRQDLPMRPAKKNIARQTHAAYDPVADARSLSAARLHKGGVHGKT